MSDSDWVSYDCAMYDAHPAVVSKWVPAKTPDGAALDYKLNLPQGVKPGKIYVSDKRGRTTVFSWDLEVVDRWT
jgi:hypothetical protein